MWKIGQKVVRVAAPNRHVTFKIPASAKRKLGWQYPDIGETCTIRAINVHPNGVLLRFEEFWNDHFVRAGHGSIEPGFPSHHFRPLIARSTDTGMAILQGILDRETIREPVVSPTNRNADVEGEA